MDREKNIDDDTVSFCGSFSGEAFSSTRRRKIQLPIKPIHIDQLADKLKINALAAFEAQHQQEPARWNTSFHHLRFIVCIMAGFAFGSMMFLRYSITVAILRMIDHTATYEGDYTNSSVSTTDDYFYEGEFAWDNEIQQMIMSWYMFAYTIPQVPCTKLATMIGARLAIPIFLSGCIISNALTPIFAYYGWQWVILLRLVNGLGASAILPMMLIIIENWMPCEEISLGLTYAQVIQASLMSLQPLLSGYLSSIHWSYAFYVPSGIATIFVIIWLMLITDKPHKSKFISQKELELIHGYHSLDQQHAEAHIEVNTIKNNKDNLSQQQQQQQPQKPIQKDSASLHENDNQIQAGLTDILKVPVFYVYLIMWSVYCGSYSVFNFVMPTYLQQFLMIGISHTGFYCALIQTGCILSCLWPHPCLYILQRKFNLSLTVSRRITHIFLCSMVAISLAYVGFNHDNQLVFFFISRCFHGSNDIVATGTIMTNFSKGGVTALAFSMINTVGNLSVVLLSSLTGYILDHTNQSPGGWSVIFIGGAGCQILMMLFYSSVVRSEPIDFPAIKKKQQKDQIQLPTNQEQQQDQQIQIKIA